MDIGHDLRRQSFDFYHRFENSIEASDSWYETSCGAFSEYWHCPGDHLLNWKDKGYVTVLNLLQNKIPSINNSKNVIDVLPHVQFNKEVRKVIYKDSLATNGQIQIECSDGSFYTSDHLICTLSLGVLKHSHLNIFEPLLPPCKFDSIEGMSMGTVDKVYAEFSTPFWHDDWEGFGLLWLPEQLKIVREDPINGDWLDGLIGFFRVSHQPNILCGWITGPRARIMEQKSEEDVKQGVCKILKMFLSKRWNVPNLKNIKW